MIRLREDPLGLTGHYGKVGRWVGVSRQEEKLEVPGAELGLLSPVPGQRGHLEEELPVLLHDKAGIMGRALQKLPIMTQVCILGT